MRTIKFRGKNKDGKWIYGGATANKKYIVNKMRFIPVDEKTVGQFTGLTDKNGVDIYEKDILTLGATGFYFYVYYGDGTWWAFDSHSDCVYHAELVRTLVENECEVVGNIFDNPKIPC